MSQISYDDLALFFIVAEKGSFLEASNHTQQSHVTLQRRITTLENILNKKLFIRSTTGVTKTAFANELISKTKIPYNNLNHYFDELMHSEENNEQVIKVFMSSGMASFFMDAIYDKLIKNEKINIEITTYTSKLIELNIDQIKPLLNNYDCIFIEGEYQHLISDLRWSVISWREGYFQFFATKNYLKSKPLIKTPNDLKQHNCLYLNHTSKNYLELINKKNSKKLHTQIRGDFSSDIIEHVLDLTTRDYGVGLLPNFYITNNLKKPLIPVLKDYYSSTHQMVCLKNSFSNNPRVDLFAAMLKQVIQGLHYHKQ